MLTFPRPIEEFTRINYTSFGAGSTYHGFQTSLRRRSRGGFFYRFNYSFSKSIDDSSGGGGPGRGGGGGGALDARNLRLERGRSNFDQRHVVTASGLYELPFGRDRKWGSGWSGVTNAVLGGWQFSSTVQAYHGQPMTITTSNVDVQAGESRRPNRVASGFQPEIAGAGLKGVDYAWFDVTAFERVPCLGTENRNGVECLPSQYGFTPFTLGNSGRNILNRPGMVQANISLQKNFVIKERRNLQLRMDAFNFLNTTNLGNPSSQFDGLDGGFIRTARQPRILQAMLEFRF